MARRRRERQRTSGPARYLAPGAFLLAVTIAVLIVRGGMADDDGTPVATAPTVVTTTAAGTTKRKPPRRGGTTTAKPRAQYYRIQQGDTLDLVALKHDTSVEALLELNPGVDTNSLQIGQRIRVK